MSGYQEVITDPSYAGQVIAFTSTHIGNYGTNAADDEARTPHCRGIVVCDLAGEPSNWRSTEALEPFLRRHGIPALTGVDTRRLARHVRRAGAVPCAFGTAPEAELRAAAAAALGTDGLDLVSGVTTSDASVHRGDGRRRGQRPAHRGLRLRRQDDHGAAAHHARHRHRGAGRHGGRRRAGARARRRVPLQRSGRPRRAAGPDRRRGGPRRARAGLRHLPRSPDPGHGAGRVDLQAALRAPRGQPSGATPRDRRGRDHEPEPQLRRGGRVHPRRRDDARQPQRRRDRGVPLPDGPRLLGAVPPGGGARAPRRPLSLRSVPPAHAGPPHPFDRAGAGAGAR